MLFTSIRLCFANETQFLFTVADTETMITSLDPRFLSQEFDVLTIMGQKCRDLKLFILNKTRNSMFDVPINSMDFHPVHLYLLFTIVIMIQTL